MKIELTVSGYSVDFPVFKFERTLVTSENNCRFIVDNQNTTVFRIISHIPSHPLVDPVHSFRTVSPI